MCRSPISPAPATAILTLRIKASYLPRIFASSAFMSFTHGSPICAEYLSTTGLTFSRIFASSAGRDVVHLHAALLQRVEPLVVAFLDTCR
jgi:hypothetical protein